MVMIAERKEAPPEVRGDVTKRLEAASWGAFFLWVGSALLVDLPIGVGLLGVGVITLLAQGLRKAFALDLEGFWVLVGLGFAVAGAWELLALETPLAPILLVGVGAALLGAALLKR
jgi:hypothetical protein